MMKRRPRAPFLLARLAAAVNSARRAELNDDEH
jgi:hypothetical protein